MDFPNVIASVGVGLLLIAFFLNVFRFLNENSLIYIILNISGAMISCYASYLIQFVPFVILEGTWALVALIVLLRKLF
ncbi:MAG: hypothetical protein H0V61_05315 [Chitinophagales bacterium]|nr:hypothetical protein [Chitinophagales bacterium]